MLLKKINFLNKIPVTLKISLWYSSLLVVILASMVIFSFSFVSDYSENMSKRELIENVNKHSHNRFLEKLPNFDDGVYYSIYTKDNNIIRGLVPNNFKVEEASENKVTEKKIEESTYYYYDLKLEGTEDMYLRGVMEVSHLKKILLIFPVALSIVSPIVLIVAVYVGYLIMKKAFDPVRKMTQTAEEISKSGNLSKRIALPETNDEINTLAATFNNMLVSLEKSSEREKRFSSDVSHELRTPITVVMAEAEYAKKYAESLDESRESLKIIERQSKRMTHMINQILEISRLDNIEKIEKDYINFSQMLEGLLYDYASLIEKNNLELRTEIERDTFLNLNRDLIHRLIDNILLNAVKYADKNVGVTLKKNKDKIVLQILDDGIGISEEEKERVWDRFYKVDKSRTRTENQSSGLGLSIVKKIVDLHEAKIKILNNTPKGTIMEITFKS